MIYYSVIVVQINDVLFNLVITTTAQSRWIGRLKQPLTITAIDSFIMNSFHNELDFYSFLVRFLKFNEKS